MKLNRAQIREGLQAVPLEALMVGVAGAKETSLTLRERRFAEGLAMGKSKAQAYREATGSKGKPATVSRRGQDLAKRGAVQAQVEALRLAAEAARHATPAALRALVIQKLTEHAIDEDVAPAQRLRALELLGKVTEVAAFTERREVVSVRDPAAAREALLEGIRSALRADSIEMAPASRPGQSGGETGSICGSPGDQPGADGPSMYAIAAELDSTAQGVTHAPAADPATRAPLDQPLASAQPLLSNPHIHPPPISVSTPSAQSALPEDPPGGLGSEQG
jgi:hypothetical protein